MNDSRYGEPQLFEAFIKSAQYFVRLKTQQDLWDHLGKFITTYFPTSWTAFVQRDAVNGISIHYCTLPDEAATTHILTDEVRTLIADVLDSGFLASQVILTPVPSMTAFLPIVENYQTEKVMLIGHRTADQLPVELLNIYLAIAGLAGTTFERLHNELELNRHRAHLEELVKERTAELAKAKRQNELILHSVREGICGLDLDGMVTFVNPFAAQMIGWNPTELVGQNAHATFHHTQRSGCPYPVEKCPVHSALTNGNTKYATDEEFSRKDGTRFPVEFTTAPIIEEGNIVGAVMVFRDITERKFAEEALRQARDELELRVRERTAELSEAKEELEVINEELHVEIDEHEKTEKDLIAAKEAAEEAALTKSDFMANMSHELRTPMNAVIGMTSLLLYDTLTPEQRDFVETIRSSGEALMVLINDVLDFSKMDKDMVELEYQTFDLRDCVQGSLDLVAANATQKGLNLAYTIGYNTPDAIVSDPTRLRQVLGNLLNNAVKFTDTGDVTVTISSRLDGSEHEVLFAVKDTGIGIPKEGMDKLFKSFSQVSASISSKYGGTGLGLAISRRLVELMGGRIWVESEEGRGSIFYFTIRAEAITGRHRGYSSGLEKKSGLKSTSFRPAIQSSQELMPANTAYRSLRILLAEDNVSNQKVTIEMLRLLGYRADIAANGIEVLQSLERQPYDVVLMDVKMPEMNGLEASIAIRKSWPAEKQPRIIAVTAYALEGDREKCIQAGMDGYISKPVKLEELQAALESCSEIMKD